MRESYYVSRETYIPSLRPINIPKNAAVKKAQGEYRMWKFYARLVENVKSIERYPA